MSVEDTTNPCGPDHRKQLEASPEKSKEVGEKDQETFNQFWTNSDTLSEAQEDPRQNSSFLYFATRPPPRMESSELAQMRAELPEGQDALVHSNDESSGARPGRLQRVGNHLMDEPVDEWVVMAINEFDGVELKSVNKKAS